MAVNGTSSTSLQKPLVAAGATSYTGKTIMNAAIPSIPARNPGFTVSGVDMGDGREPGPLVLASPHSGRDYPQSFLDRTRLTIAQLRRAEDAFVDDLFAGTVGRGVPMVAARFGRSWLDLNRAEDELDPSMFIEPLDAHPAQRSDRVQGGLGVLPRVAAHGLDIYPGRIPLAEAAARIISVHRPYHEELGALLDRARRAHGFAVLIDCHSMPTPPPVAGGAPQIVLGDLHGVAAAPALVELIERHFRAAGFRVARNSPYAGGYTTAFHGQPVSGVHAVQIEVDRALYMDPARLVRHMGFVRVTATMTALVELLLARLPTLGLIPPLAFAAE